MQRITRALLAITAAAVLATGADQGCIACHQRAEGDDYVYTHDRLAE